MLLTQILQKIRAAFYTKAETDTKLNGKSNTNHNHNSTYLGIEAKAESAKSADSVAWSGISNKPSTYPPSSHTHDDRYYTESEVNNLLNGKANTSGTYSGLNAGNADTVDGSHAWQMQTLNADGGTHGSGQWLMQCQYKADGEHYFKLYVGDKSIETKVDRASSAAYAERSMNNGPFYISGYQIYVG